LDRGRFGVQYSGHDAAASAWQGGSFVIVEVALFNCVKDLLGCAAIISRALFFNGFTGQYS